MLGLVPRHAPRIALLNDLPDRAQVGHEVDVVAPEQPRHRQRALGHSVVRGHEKDALHNAIGHQQEIGPEQRLQPGTALE